MTPDEIIGALALPQDSRVHLRVPKTLLNENGAPTPADKRQINDGIEELLWVASLKSTNIGVPEFRDATREYLEVAVLTVALRSEASVPRITELVHRAIPYPVFLVSGLAGETTVSLAHKRFSQGEAGKTVLDGEVVSVSVPSSDAGQEFLGSLALASQAKASMYALYQGWISCIEACKASAITGRFVAKPVVEDAEMRREALAEHAKIEREIAVLRSRATKEKQMSRRIGLNAEIKRLESRLGELATRL